MPVLFLEVPGLEARLEQQRDPQLRGRPVIVARPDPTGRARIVAASPEAAARGVPAEATLGEALRHCPEAVVREPRPGRVAQFYRCAVACAAAVSRRVETAGVRQLYAEVGAPEAGATARDLLGRIAAATGLAPRAGLGASKVVARAAARLAEDGEVREVAAGEEAAVLRELPVRCLWGVDLRTEAALHELGVATAGELRGVSRARLEARFGPAVARSLWEQARGQDRRGVVAFVEPARAELAEVLEPPGADARDLAARAGLLAEALAADLGGTGVARWGVRLEAVDGSLQVVEAPAGDAADRACMLERLPCSLPVRRLSVFAEIRVDGEGG